jgi:single-strand DNA-binding protein
MPARTTPTTTGDAAEEAVNDIRLRGRLAAVATARELPSGDEVVTFRLVVDRPARARRSASSARVDTLDCAAFASGVRRRSQQWQPGDVLEVQGSLRRRFFRTGGGPASRYEVEVASATRVARAPA